jgi:hypothetical protein
MTDEEYLQFQEWKQRSIAREEHPAARQPQPQLKPQPQPQPKQVKRTAEQQRLSGFSMLLILGAIICLLAPIGALFFAVNGGYSIEGLNKIADAFNAPGRFIWAFLSTFTFHVPVVLPGLPETQPVIPWLIVVGTSILQVMTMWLKVTGRYIPRWLMGLASVLSLYDLGTTFVGFSAVAWIIKAGVLLQAPLAVLFTFGFEAALSLMLRKLFPR